MRTLPELGDHRKWWVVESLNLNLEANEKFRLFEAVIGHDEDEAILHKFRSDGQLNQALMNNALRNGKIESEAQWAPVSELVKILAVGRVACEEEIQAHDPVLLEMLVEHEFFLEDFIREPATAIGGGVYDPQ
ncbi:MAG: hypothetical protein CFE33_20415 [Pseudorhodobacter sp. PARRP1]|nr:MAG: hypothetical protein CFE33_20415 [Pseudorhodobacter sp. PARRP1]